MLQQPHRRSYPLWWLKGLCIARNASIQAP
ncbi:hypothetical protein LINPERPRIM_LOCUS8942 [Linum perenne]